MICGEDDGALGEQTGGMTVCDKAWVCCGHLVSYLWQESIFLVDDHSPPCLGRELMIAESLLEGLPSGSR